MNREIFEKQNFGNQLGFGKSPCLLVIDFTISFADPDILGGGNILNAIENTKDLLKISRKKLLPIIFTKVVLDPTADQNLLFAKKAPALLDSTSDSYLSDIVDSLQPLQNETIIEKKQASAFFQTNLHELLIQDNIDTVIMTGCTTSGCVRASAVDCISLNLRPIIVADCVGDRSLESHELSLFEMNSKYADVVLKKDTIEYLQNL
ncbi:MAG: isochorismatase family protein [Dehalococcoidia bacterium]|nr:isochorismatase family protein [Dehalococcoidia bacterium]|tara:strand:- start:178 stop:795 length:618 start_codon:yes stop_codon:yes gene_type:complete